MTYKLEFKITLLFLWIVSPFISQSPQALIPKDALVVFSIHDFSKIKELSLNELMSYPFMSELEQEQYDGSTEGKSIKGSGIDMNQKMSVFSGKNKKFSISGVTFGIKNKKELFNVFDDFNKEESKYPDFEFYSSYFNNLFISNTTALLFRLECNEKEITRITDSIWADNYNYNYNFSETTIEEVNVLEQIEETDEGSDFEEENLNELTYNDENKGYLELRDSVQYAMHQIYEEKVLYELLVNKENLINRDSDFKKQINRTTDGSIYFDNSRTAMGFWNKYNLTKSAIGQLGSLYNNNKTLGDLTFSENGLKLKLTSLYTDEMGAIYSELNKTGLNSEIRKYIPKNIPSFFIYKINLNAAYEKALEVLMPIFRNQNNVETTKAVMMFDLLNAFIDKETLFKTCQGSLFVTFNGITEIKTDKIKHVYNEETFEYTQIISKKEEKMPLFTLGLVSENQSLLEKIFKSISKLNPLFKQKSDYWILEDAVMNSSPIYFFHHKKLFFITNDIDMIKKNRNGYSEETLSKKEFKSINKGGAIYFKSNLDKTTQQLPSDLFSEKEAEFISFIKKGSGSLEFTSSLTNKNKTEFEMLYSCNNQEINKGVHLLDLINAIYLFTNN